MAAKGTILEKPISFDEILRMTQGGWDLWRLYIGQFPVCKAFRHPLKKDKTPSGAIFMRDGVWFLTDFAGTIPTMTPLQFVQQKWGLNFKDAIQKICQDIGINRDTKIYVPKEIIDVAPVYEESEIHIGFSDKKWGKEQHKFWENTEVDEAHCLKYNTFAVKEVAINRRRVAIKPKEVVWAYYVPEQERVKLYFPEREGKAKHRGNVGNNFIWNLSNIEECDNLIVQKSMKDLLVTAVITPCVVAVQNESAKRFINAETAKQIQGLAKNIFLAYGSDQHGKENSIILSKEYGFGWVNPSNKYLEEGINDSYALSHKYGIEEWKKCLKNKKIIQ